MDNTCPAKGQSWSQESLKMARSSSRWTGYSEWLSYCSEEIWTACWRTWLLQVMFDSFWKLALGNKAGSIWNLYFLGFALCLLGQSLFCNCRSARFIHLPSPAWKLFVSVEAAECWVDLHDVSRHAWRNSMRLYHTLTNPYTYVYNPGIL